MSLLQTTALHPTARIKAKQTEHGFFLMLIAVVLTCIFAGAAVTQLAVATDLDSELSLLGP